MSISFPPLPPFFIQPGFGDMPVGSVIAFAGPIASPRKASAPVAGASVEALGWLVCDGRMLDSNDYPQLYVVLGHLYGGLGQQFRLPDYRGYFLRGMDSGKGNDGDADQRTDPAGATTLNQGVGSRQEDALQTHEHLYKSAPTPAAPSGPGSVAGAPASSPALTEGGPTNGLTPPGGVRVSTTETRPKNIYVSYLIKCTYGLHQHRHHFHFAHQEKLP
ncbi:MULTISPECIES: tail fiber protein [unclassified Janthinobacterium]|uniref:tail fiber protein n=1 Tax=unclassified Janthinobacterium TaxID=2610881 RepID=UPI00161225EE|nr:MULTISPECIES: tail fiber protein [unclassified Janthinobacterium]MBB5606456.1 microcystin-dependent protein [Janthinobacterium sp. S3T4]MBB5611672.1 microcystin-dependent protein [Janthinobacterium sp. S3M3]